MSNVPHLHPSTRPRATNHTKVTMTTTTSRIYQPAHHQHPVKTVSTAAQVHPTYHTYQSLVMTTNTCLILVSVPSFNSTQLKYFCLDTTVLIKKKKKFK